MHIADLDTPAVLIDIDRVEANLARAQAYADRHGLTLRPHIKTHKLPRLAQRQVALGAVGITCQKIGEAEVMAGRPRDRDRFGRGAGQGRVIRTMEGNAIRAA